MSQILLETVLNLIRCGYGLNILGYKAVVNIKYKYKDIFLKDDYTELNEEVVKDIIKSTYTDGDQRVIIKDKEIYIE